MAVTASPGAVFFDKDGTLVPDRPYDTHPAHCRLRRAAGPALGRLAKAGWQLFVVTNQPGVARGWVPPAALPPLWAALQTQAAAHGARFAGFYHCPHLPAAEGGRCLCRKPRPGLLHQAARAHGLDLTRCWMVGDILDDIEAGRRAGCRTLLLDVGNETVWCDGPLRRPHAVVSDLGEAADVILGTAAGAARQLAGAGT